MLRSARIKRFCRRAGEPHETLETLGSSPAEPCKPLNNIRFANNSMEFVVLARALLLMNRIEPVPRWTALEIFRGMS